MTEAQGYAKASWANKLAAMTMDLIGVSSYISFWKHAVIHHRYVNITGYDTDCDIGILGRLSPHSKWLPFHRWQHFYFWLLYGVAAAKMEFVDDFKRVIRGRIGGHRSRDQRGGTWRSSLPERSFFSAGYFCFRYYSTL